MTDTATLTLTEFLLARIAEDEAVARSASEGDWYPAINMGRGPRPTGVIAEDSLGDWLGTVAKETTEDDADHIARHNPARVLAECEAKRRVVDDAAQADAAGMRGDLFGDFALGLGWAVGILASVYADHPDYRDEWRP